jgi:hypothetical protein
MRRFTVESVLLYVESYLYDAYGCFYMKLTWDQYQRIFYTYPNIELFWMKFSTIQYIGKYVADCVLICEYQEFIDEDVMIYTVKLEKPETEFQKKEEFSMLIAKNPFDDVSGVFLYNQNMILLPKEERKMVKADSETIAYLRENLEQIDVDAIYVRKNGIIESFYDISTLNMAMAKDHFVEETDNPERKEINQMFYDEVFRQVSLINVETRQDLLDEIYKVKSSLPEGIAHGIADYIISRGAVTPA